MTSLSQLRMERLGCRTLSVCLRMDFTKDAESTGFIQAGCTLYHPLPRFCGNSCLSYSSRFNTLSGHRMEAGHVGEVGLPVEGMHIHAPGSILLTPFTLWMLLVLDGPSAVHAGSCGLFVNLTKAYYKGTCIHIYAAGGRVCRWEHSWSCVCLPLEPSHLKHDGAVGAVHACMRMYVGTDMHACMLT